MKITQNSTPPHYWALPGIKENVIVDLDKMSRINTLVYVGCEFFGLKKSTLSKRCRKGEYVEARQMIMSFLANTDKYDDEMVGGAFKRHRTTVYHAVKTVKNLTETDPNYRETYTKLSKTLCAEQAKFI